MSGKLARIFAIVGGGLTLLPNLISIASYLVTLSLPDEGLHFEAKGYASGFLMLTILPCIISLAGFISSFLIRRKPLLSAVLTIACGFLMTNLMPISYFGISALFEPNIIIYNNIFEYLIRIPPLILIAAGVLTIIYRESVKRSKQNDTIQHPDMNENEQGK